MATCLDQALVYALSKMDASTSKGKVKVNHLSSARVTDLFSSPSISHLSFTKVALLEFMMRLHSLQKWQQQVVQWRSPSSRSHVDDIL